MCLQLLDYYSVKYLLQQVIKVPFKITLILCHSGAVDYILFILPLNSNYT